MTFLARSPDISKIIILFNLYAGRKFLSKVINKNLNGCEERSAKCVQS